MKWCPDRMCIGGTSVYINTYNYCPVCGKGLITTPVCPGCKQTLTLPRTPYCSGCGAET